MKKNLSILSLSLLAVMLSCSPSVKILGSWTGPSTPPEGYNNIFVTALTDNILARQTVETDLDNLLLEEGVNAESSFDILPPGFKSSGVDKEEVLRKMSSARGNHFDPFYYDLFLDSLPAFRKIARENP